MKVASYIKKKRNEDKISRILAEEIEKVYRLYDFGSFGFIITGFDINIIFQIKMVKNKYLNKCVS